MAVPAAIPLNPQPYVAPVLQAVYTAGDADKLTMVQVAAGIFSVEIYNRAGATLLVQTANAVQGASVASSAAQVIQTGRVVITSGKCNASPVAAWSFGLASSGSAVADLTATAL